MHKKGSIGRANQSKPGGEYYYDCGDDFDCTDLSPNEAIACGLDSLSEEKMESLPLCWWEFFGVLAAAVLVFLLRVIFAHTKTSVGSLLHPSLLS